MLLPQQIQAILYHLLMGWVYALGFSFIIAFLKYRRFPVLKGITEIIYHILYTLLMFYGLYQINGGITNMYLIGFFILGTLLYYAFYLKPFMEMFSGWRRILYPIRKKLVLVKTKMFVIIRLPAKIMKRRKANVKKRKKARKIKRDKRKKKKASAKNLS